MLLCICISSSKFWLYIHKELSPVGGNPHDALDNNKRNNFDLRILCTYATITTCSDSIINFLNIMNNPFIEFYAEKTKRFQNTRYC